ncbi:MAG: Omp28-related outer membrane protein [Bacteroidetes bacterium]|nr:Omp28-related outer membrane protein [Bacteroidota bacterium]
MQTRIIALLFTASIFFFSCKEEDHGILNTKDKPVALKDTSYISSDNIPSVYKKILLEDITGVRCVNCPKAAEESVRLKAKYGDTIVPMAIYIRSLPFNSDPWAGYADLRTDVAEEVANAIGMPVGLPGGYVDRYKFGANAALVINQWENSYKQRRGVSPVSIALSFENSSNNKIIIRTKLTYTEDKSNESHKLALYIIEDGIVGKQSTNGAGAPYIENYEFNHVLRGSIGNALGSRLGEPLVKGRIFEKDFEFDWNNEWIQNSCSLIAVVLDESDNSVVQVEEIPLH